MTYADYMVVPSAGSGARYKWVPVLACLLLVVSSGWVSSPLLDHPVLLPPSAPRGIVDALSYFSEGRTQWLGPTFPLYPQLQLPTQRALDTQMPLDMPSYDADTKGTPGLSHLKV